MLLPADDLSKRQNYFLMTSLVVPRPIAWIGTAGLGGGDEGEDTHDNLAPFSYFMGVSSDPPIVAVSIARARGGALKDTLRNLLATQRCTLSVVSQKHLLPMHATGGSFPPEVDEFTEAGLDKERWEGLPVVADAPAAMLCQLHRAEDLGSTHLVLLRVLAYRVDPVGFDAENTRMRPDFLKPVGRLGGSYALLGQEITP